MSADRPAASNGGPGVSRTRRPVSDRIPLLHFQSAFQQVRHCAGDPAAARHFMCPSARIIDRLSSGVQRGRAVIPRPVVVVPGPIGHCASLVLFPLPLPVVLWRFRHATASCVDRSMGSPHQPETAWDTGRRSPLPLRAPAGDPTLITPVKGTYSGKIASLDRDPGIANLDPGINIPTHTPV